MKSSSIIYHSLQCYAPKAINSCKLSNQLNFLIISEEVWVEDEGIIQSMPKAR
jgi:hypothetical protein